MMHMTYYLSDQIGHLLFEKWQISTTGGIVGSCIVIALWVILLEAVKTARVFFNKKSTTRPSGSSSQSVTEDPLLPSLVVPPTIANYRRKRIKYHVLQTVLHALNVVIGYFIMLAVMTFNGWISIAVAIASGLAFYVFGAVRHVLQEPSAIKSTSDTNVLENSRSSSTSAGHLQSSPSGLYPERS